MNRNFEMKANGRINALQSYDILDSLPEEEYNQITFIASQICDTPISLITLLDDKRQWFKSKIGLEADETPIEYAFCTYALDDPGNVLVVNDARKDERFKNNPLVHSAPNVIFYAGAPINTPQGDSLGTLCVVDNKPRDITQVQKEALKALSNYVVTLLELRKKNRELENLNKEIKKANAELDKFSFQLSHDLRTPARAILTINQWIKNDHYDNLDEDLKEKLEIIDARTKYIYALIQEMLNYAKATRSEIEYEEFNVQETILKIVHGYDHYKVENISLRNTDQSIYQSRVALSVCLHNLLSNSVKYNDKDECKIDIELSENTDAYIIHFYDNGPGIDKKYQNKVFEMYETLGRKSENSTGIGLATVKAVLTKLGGEITFLNNIEYLGVGYEIVLPKTKR